MFGRRWFGRRPCPEQERQMDEAQRAEAEGQQALQRARVSRAEAKRWADRLREIRSQDRFAESLRQRFEGD